MTSDESGGGANEDSNETTDEASPPADNVDTGVPIIPMPMPPPTQAETAATEENVDELKSPSQEDTPAAAAPVQTENQTAEEAIAGDDSDDMHDLD